MSQVELRLTLEETVAGAIGGVQFGSGSAGHVKQWHRMDGKEFTFVLHAEARDDRLPLRGDAIQKDGKGRFVYIVWRDDSGAINRRAKVYLETIDQTMLDSQRPLTIRLPGKAKDGWPCCATVKPLRDWVPA